MPRYKTHQQIFNHVVKAMRCQGEPSVDANNACVYRNKDGLKCAVGCLISDESYNEEIEGCALSILPSRMDKACDGTENYNLLAQILIDMGIDVSNENTIELLDRLQNIHDDIYRFDSDCWTDSNRKLRSVAEDFGLKIPK